MSRSRSLPTAARLAYAAPAFALAAVGIPIYVHLPKFYTDVVGVPVGVVGVLLMAGRLFDGGIDPLVGALSDRTRSRWGRRRPWIVGAALPLAACLWLLFTPPLGDAGVGAWWFGSTMFATFLAWTLVTVPYEALGAEITRDYDERTAVLALRDGALLLGTLVAAASPAIAGALLGMEPGPAAEAARFRAVALGYAPLILVACVACAWKVAEKPQHAAPEAAQAGRRSVRESWRSMRENRPFVILLASYTVAALGSNLPGTLILFYVEYVLGSRHADLLLLLYMVTGVAFLPLWVRLAGRADKKASWLAATAVNTVAFAGVAFLGEGDEGWYALLVVLSGVGFGATVALPSSMQADVIDYDELRTGQRREGLYLGAWSIARKAAAALGVGLGLRVLEASGYVPGVPQGPAVKQALSVLYAVVPCACNAAGFALALAYPITRGRHAAIAAAIEARRRGEDIEDPLRPGVVLSAAGPATEKTDA